MNNPSEKLVSFLKLDPKTLPANLYLAALATHTLKAEGISAKISFFSEETKGLGSSKFGKDFGFVHVKFLNEQDLLLRVNGAKDGDKITYGNDSIGETLRQTEPEELGEVLREYASKPHLAEEKTSKPAGGLLGLLKKGWRYLLNSRKGWDPELEIKR